jgi:hypothetical protein
VGDQVALYYISTPRGYRWAAAGRPNISPHVTRMGVDIDGAFAEYVVRPISCLVRPPEPVAPEALAVLTDAVATPLHGLKRVARLQAGETLVVVGVGGLGSSAVQLGKAFGARVIAVTRSQARLELAARMGADETVPADADDAVARVRDLAGGHGVDVVLQCAGSARADEQAIAMGGPGGRVVLIGAALEPFSVRATEIFWRELPCWVSWLRARRCPDAIDLYLAGAVRGCADEMTRPLGLGEKQHVAVPGEAGSSCPCRTVVPSVWSQLPVAQVPGPTPPVPPSQGMLAIGMVFIVVIRDIDLSVGWMLNFSAVVAGTLMVNGLGPSSRRSPASVQGLLA